MITLDDEEQDIVIHLMNAGGFNTQYLNEHRKEVVESLRAKLEPKRAKDLQQAVDPTRCWCCAHALLGRCGLGHRAEMLNIAMQKVGACDDFKSFSDVLVQNPTKPKPIEEYR